MAVKEPRKFTKLLAAVRLGGMENELTIHFGSKDANNLAIFFSV